MSQELREKLSQISSNVQQINATLGAAAKLVESGRVTVTDASENLEEGQEPASIILSGEIVGTVVRPVTATLNQRKEQLLAAKEQILNMLEGEVSGQGGDAPNEIQEPVGEPVESPES